MSKPKIIVLAEPGDNEFPWMSGGWNSEENKHTREAKNLCKIASDCVLAATDYDDAIARLTEAGFYCEVPPADVRASLRKDVGRMLGAPNN